MDKAIKTQLQQRILRVNVLHFNYFLDQGLSLVVCRVGWWERIAARHRLPEEPRAAMFVQERRTPTPPILQDPSEISRLWNLDSRYFWTLESGLWTLG